jgi:hypothetical protein
VSTSAIELQERINARAHQLHAGDAGDLVQLLERCALDLAPGWQWVVMGTTNGARPSATLVLVQQL